MLSKFLYLRVIFHFYIILVKLCSLTLFPFFFFRIYYFDGPLKILFLPYLQLVKYDEEIYIFYKESYLKDG